MLNHYTTWPVAAEYASCMYMQYKDSCGNGSHKDQEKVLKKTC